MKAFIANCWDEVVFEKWGGCFTKEKVEDDYGDLVSIRFSKEYYIQKPLGTKSINKIIEECFDKTSNLSAASKVKLMTGKLVELLQD